MTVAFDMTELSLILTHNLFHGSFSLTQFLIELLIGIFELLRLFVIEGNLIL